MKAQVFKTSVGFDIINSKGELFTVTGNQAQKKGTVGEKFKPSGKLLKKIPNHLKDIFFNLQKQEQ